MTSSKKTAAVGSTARRTAVGGKRVGLARARAGASTAAEARAYRGRLEEWTGSLGPRNAIERYLLERAVSLSWQLDRADRSRPAPIVAVDSEGQPDSVPPPVPGDTRASERLLRHQLACGRALMRTLNAFAKMRELAGAGPGREEEDEAPPTEAASSGFVPSRSRLIGRPAPGSNGWPRDRSSPTAEPGEAAGPRRRVGGYAVPMDPSIPVSCADKIPVRLRRARAAVPVG